MNWYKPVCVVEREWGGKKDRERLEGRVKERQSYALRLRRMKSLDMSEKT